MVLKIKTGKSFKMIIKKAAGIIRRGGLVVFPTETVYGLGANALDKGAVKKIFKAKGRPADNPLIVHIASFNDLGYLVGRITPLVRFLTRKFWPGPLTLVLPKKKIIPDEVTAGRNTIAIRMPDHKVALALIKEAGVPIAAPSANISTRPSPTTAKHAFDDLKNKVDLIIDAGSTKVGLESTVLDLTGKTPVILRPGGITKEELEEVLGKVLISGKIHGAAKSPGQKYRHYAPRARLILVSGNKIQNVIKREKRSGNKVGVLVTKESENNSKMGDVVKIVGPKRNLKKVAHNMFRMIRELDSRKVDVIVGEIIPEKGLGAAIMNRLKKAASRE